MENRHPLREYQMEIGRAVMDSVTRGKGLTFTVEIARQGGKNELSAQMATLLLTMSMARGGNMIKAAPTFMPQALISMNRLKERLDDAGYGGVWRTESGHNVVLGRARQMFLSAEPHSNVVGNTAHILLEMDEAQSIDSDKYHKEFRPMGASTNVTTVLYGTPWDGHSLLEEVAATNLELERKDGVKRHFSVPWEEVARHSPPYRRYVEMERERMGENHPLFRTQYLLVPVSGRGGLFTAGDTSQLQGSHSRQRGLARGSVYVAGLDVGGGLAGGSDGVSASGRRPDSTVLTIGELDFSSTDALQRDPAIRVVEHYEWQGIAHHALYPRLVDLLKNVWRCRRIAVDATGMGEGVASVLSKALGASAVTSLRFSAQSKSRLGLRPALGGQFRSAEDVRAGRFRRVGGVLAAGNVGAGPVSDGQDHELLRGGVPGPRRLSEQPGASRRGGQVPAAGRQRPGPGKTESVGYGLRLCPNLPAAP